MSESDLKKEATDFSRFIVIESFDDIYQAKYLPFLTENIIAMRDTPQNAKKHEMKTSLLGWTAGSRQKTHPRYEKLLLYLM